MEPIERNASGQLLFQYQCIIQPFEFKQGLPRTKKRAAEHSAAREALLEIFDVADSDCHTSLVLFHHEGT